LKTVTLHIIIIVLLGQASFSQDLDNPLTLEKEWSGYSIGDPYVLKHRGLFYLYCSTKDAETGIKCWSSRDLVNWTYAGLCATDPITKGAYAPEVIYWNGIFYMYTSPAGNGHYVLSSASPTGLFEIISSNLGKSIDGSVFIDSDARWYFYHASSQGILGCPMSGPASIGAGKNLNACMNNSWTEGPCVFKRNGKYYMIYTGNHVISLGYRIDYAINSTGPIEPYTPAHQQNPILLETMGYHVGLGHGSIFIGPDLDSYYLTYHNLVSAIGPFRRLNFDRIAWNGDKMILLGPTAFAQENPELPDAYDFFDRDTIGSGWIFSTGSIWKTEENGWITQDTTIAGDDSWCMAILDSTSSPNYTAEFNLRQTYAENNDAKFGAVFSYTNEQNYGVAALNSTTNSIEINFLTDSTWGTPHIVEMPVPLDYSKWHQIRIEKFNGQFKIFVDGMLITTIPNEAPGGEIGYLTRWCHGNFGFLAFSNNVNGSGTFDVYKPVPGKLPAVQYNAGGEGIGYHEENPSVSAENILRMDEVELVESSLGGYGLASLETGDWFDYNINVEMDRSYNVNIVYASTGENCRIHFYLDGSDISGDVDLPSTGGNNSWKSALVKDLSLQGGYHTLRAKVISGSFHLYSMEILVADNVDFDETRSFEGTFGTGWKYDDGDWSISNGNAYIDGYGKRTFGSKAWRDYTVETDIMFTRSMNAGLIFRVSNPALGGAGDSPSQGTDYLQGYFVGFNYSTVVLGKHNYGWESLNNASGNFSLNTWYHLRVVVNDNRIRVYVDDLNTPLIDYTDPIPLISGMAGLRSFNTGVRYKNFHVTSRLLTSPPNRISGEGIPDRINLYPNPAGRFLYIDFGKEEPRQISISDLKGMGISTFESNDRQISIPVFDLTKGVYIVKIQSASGLHTKKIIVNE
jgi:xylan 1,4-beta-xylosidase